LTISPPNVLDTALEATDVSGFTALTAKPVGNKVSIEIATTWRWSSVPCESILHPLPGVSSSLPNFYTISPDLGSRKSVLPTGLTARNTMAHEVVVVAIPIPSKYFRVSALLHGSLARR
jgi:hypothetical protein